MILFLLMCELIFAASLMYFCVNMFFVCSAYYTNVFFQNISKLYKFFIFSQYETDKKLNKC